MSAAPPEVGVRALVPKLRIGEEGETAVAGDRRRRPDECHRAPPERRLLDRPREVLNRVRGHTPGYPALAPDKRVSTAGRRSVFHIGETTREPDGSAPVG